MSFARMFGIALVLIPSFLAGQEPEVRSGDWRFLTRATLSGDSHESTPADYRIYSGLTLEAAVARQVADHFALELSVRSESREVEGPSSLGEPRLGSLAMVPINLTLKWQPRGGTAQVFQPYAGAGLNLTVVWEKSGPLDSTDPPASLGPVGQFGSELMLSPKVVLSLDVKWHPFDVHLEGLAEPAPTVAIDPLILGVGLGFVF